MPSPYIHIILPISPGFIPTYRTEVDVHRGQRVRVEFARREYIGVIDRTGVIPDIDSSRIQTVKSAETGLPDISAKELDFWHFISDYYLCPIGDVFKAACPLLKTRSEQTAAAARERKRIADARMEDALKRRIQSLEGRLRKKNEELPTHKEGTAITKRLKSDIERISAELLHTREALERHLAAIEAHNQQTENALPTRGDLPCGKPEVFQSANRTERYLKEVKATLDSGRDALVLIPEIAVGDTLQQDFQNELGPRLYIHNSSCSPKSRRETAEALRDSRAAEVIIGTRISLFLPFRDLGLIIIDEEQDPSYKQTEPAPRINARDAAIMLGLIHKAKVILGSNCPSLETVYNIKCGKYFLTRSTDGSTVPENISIIDIAAEKRKNGISGHFTYKLINAIRRCNGPVRLIRGWEDKVELEAETAALFPDRTIQILTLQESYAVKSEASLTAVLQADAMFRKDDFRADEKVLQSLKRLQGRSSSMIIQTAKSGHPVFKIMEGALEIEALLQERKAFHLPPYSRLVDIILRDDNNSRLSYLGRELSGRLKEKGIVPMCIPCDGSTILRTTLPKSGSSVREKLLAIIRDFEKERNYFGHIIMDADPQ